MTLRSEIEALRDELANTVCAAPYDYWKECRKRLDAILARTSEPATLPKLDGFQRVVTGDIAFMCESCGVGVYSMTAHAEWHRSLQHAIEWSSKGVTVEIGLPPGVARTAPTRDGIFRRRFIGANSFIESVEERGTRQDRRKGGA